MANAIGGGGLASIGRAIGNGIASVGNYTAAAANKANGVSFAAQSAQGNFNQASANTANALADTRLADMYAYNSAGAAEANNFTQMMWDKAAAWNEQMMQKQMDFNAEQAQINRNFQKEMDSTKYARAVKDMKNAGLNPILAVTGGGISSSGASGTAASVSAPSMGSASGAQASGSTMNGISASEGNFTGQMEYMSGILGLISAAIGGFSSAFSNLGSLGDLGEGLGTALMSAITKDKEKSANKKETGNSGKSEHNGGYMAGPAGTYNAIKDAWNLTKKSSGGHSR